MQDLNQIGWIFFLGKSVKNGNQKVVADGGDDRPRVSTKIIDPL